VIAQFLGAGLAVLCFGWLLVSQTKAAAAEQGPPTLTS
jgi:hypothetical protein